MHKGTTLKGQKIVDVREMTKQEMDSEGWEGNKPSVLVLEDGSKIYPSSDEEGNSAGSLFGQKGKNYFRVSFLE